MKRKREQSGELSFNYYSDLPGSYHSNEMPLYYECPENWKPIIGRALKERKKIRELVGAFSYQKVDSALLSRVLKWKASDEDRYIIKPTTMEALKKFIDSVNEGSCKDDEARLWAIASLIQNDITHLYNHFEESSYNNLCAVFEAYWRQEDEKERAKEKKGPREIAPGFVYQFCCYYTTKRRHRHIVEEKKKQERLTAQAHNQSLLNPPLPGVNQIVESFGPVWKAQHWAMLYQPAPVPTETNNPSNTLTLKRQKVGP